jgi:membrane associated rhomboid family serine protease
MSDGAEVAIEATADEQEARDRLVVLAAAGIGARMEHRSDGWVVVVAAGDVGRSRAAIADYLEELAAPSPGDLEWGPTNTGFLIATALVAAHALTGFRADGRPAFLAGEGASAAILGGQPWRVVTALWLHADWTHLLGNVAAIAVLGTAVCRLLGPGLGALLILVTGAAGNFLNAAVRGGAHTSVGASTAIFGAVGLLAGLAVIRAHPPRGRGWVPFAAGLALLGLLGTGEHVDLAAHFFGFQMGLGLGMAIAVASPLPPGPRWQRALGVAAAGIVGLAWLLAVGSIPRR